MPTRKYDLVAAKYECPSSRYMRVGATRIHYCVEGRGPTLVLLHGLIGSLHSWNGWVKALAPHYRIVRIDLPGFGLSDHLASDDYTPEHAVQLLEQVRTQLHLERFHLAGSSLGGFFSWYYAAHHPERVEKLILIGSLGYRQELPALVALLSLPFVGTLSRAASPRRLVEYCLRQVYGDPARLSDEVIDRHYELLTRGRNRAALMRTFRRLRMYKNDAEISRQIPRIRAQTLLMWGERDRWVPLSLLEAWRRDLPAAKVKVYPGAGHLPMEELPEETAADAHAFLSAGEKSTRDDATTRKLEPQVVPFVYARGA